MMTAPDEPGEEAPRCQRVNVIWHTHDWQVSSPRVCRRCGAAWPRTGRELREARERAALEQGAA